MIFYPRYVADLQKKVSQFSMLERGALEPLLDHLYVQETPYIESLIRAFIIAKATSKAEKAAVQYVLDQCFQVIEDGRYFQKRASLEIPKAMAKITAAQKNGRLGGRKPAQPSGLSNGLTGSLSNGLPNQNQNQNQMITSVNNHYSDRDKGPSKFTTQQVKRDPATSGNTEQNDDGGSGFDESIDYGHVAFPENAEISFRQAFERTCRKLNLTSNEATQLGQELLARIETASTRPELRIKHVERWLEVVVKSSRSSGQQILRAGIDTAKKVAIDLARKQNEKLQNEQSIAEANQAKDRTEKAAAAMSSVKESELQLIHDRTVTLIPPTLRTKFDTAVHENVYQRKIPSGIVGWAMKRAVAELGFLSKAGQ